MDLVNAYLVASTVAMGLLSWWFWPHCAAPALYYAGASPRVLRIHPWFAVVAVAAQAISLGLRLRGIDPPAPLVLAGWGLGLWFLAAYVAPSLVAAFEGGRDDRLGLLRAYASAHQRAVRAAMTPKEIKQVRREVEGLNRYRNPDTNAWIDLVQAELVELAEGASFGEVATGERSKQIVTLGMGLFPDTAAPPLHDIAQR